MYKPFLISEFTSGLFTYLQPWISPRDSFTKTRNVYVNRGCLFSREGLDLINRRFFSKRVHVNGQQFSINLQGAFIGSIQIYGESILYHQNKDGSFKKIVGTDDIQFDFDPNTFDLSGTFTSAVNIVLYITYVHQGTPIRGIISFNDQDQQGVGFLLVDDKGLCCFFRNERVHNLLVDQLGSLFKRGESKFSFYIPWDFDLNTLELNFDVNGSKTRILGSNLVPQGIVTRISFDPGTNILSGTIQTVANDTSYVSYTLYPNTIFQGFGNIVSWDISKNYVVISNGVDRVLFFDIIKKTISKPYLPITEKALWSGTNQIANTQYVKFFKNRLLLLNNRIENAGDQDGFWSQSIRWSTPYLSQSSLFSHWNFVSDKPYGGEYSPDTNATVVSCGSVKDKLIVWYDEDVYSMEPTNVSQIPFVFNKINSSRYASCPFTSTDLDSTTQVLGRYGFLQSDGISVSRMDLSIPDYYKKIDFIHRERIMSHRFSGEDSRICTVYPSFSAVNSECDSILVYNFVENTFSEYSWGKPTVSCIGSIRYGHTVVWGDMRNYLFNPKEASFLFSSFINRSQEIVSVAGGAHGELYALRGSYDFNYLEDDIEPFSWEFSTCRFGPYLQEGYASFFGFLDIYFEGFGKKCPIILDIYSDGNNTPCKTVSFNLEAKKGVQTFHRVQLQVAAQLVELNFRSNDSIIDRGPLKIIGMILWAEKGGDIRNIKKLI